MAKKQPSSQAEEVKEETTQTETAPVPSAEAVSAPEEQKPVPQSAEEENKPGKPPKEEEIQEMTTLHERTIAALSYFGFLAIVPFYLKKESKFCRFHGKQGLTLAIIFFLAKFVAVLDIVMDLTLILQAVIALWMGFAALSGKWKKTPVIYNWSCQLEEALRLKSKEEEAEQLQLAPNQIKAEVVDDASAKDNISK